MHHDKVEFIQGMWGFSTLENVLMLLCTILEKLLGHNPHVSAHLANRHWLTFVWDCLLSMFVKWTALENRDSVSLWSERQACLLSSMMKIMSPPRAEGRYFKIWVP